MDENDDDDDDVGNSRVAFDDESINAYSDACVVNVESSSRDNIVFDDDDGYNC